MERLDYHLRIENTGELQRCLNNGLDEDKLHVKGNSQVLCCFILLHDQYKVTISNHPTQAGKKTSFHQHLNLSAFVWFKSEASFYRI